MTTLGEQIGFLRRTLHRLLVRRLGLHGRRPLEQLRLLKTLEREGHQTQAALAERLLVDPPAVSRLVDRLEADGLLRRCSGTDRRCVRLELTATGHDEVQAFSTELAWLEREAGRHLSERELATLKQLLAKLNAGLTADAEHAMP